MLRVQLRDQDKQEPEESVGAARLGLAHASEPTRPGQDGAADPGDPGTRGPRGDARPAGGGVDFVLPACVSAGRA